MTGMVEHTHPNGVVTLRSPLLDGVGVVHAFSTRRGGVSQPPFDSLNLGGMAKGEGDANAHVAANFRRLREAIAAPSTTRRVVVKQVHGAAVWRPPAEPVKPADAPEADAIISHDARHLLTIRTADCVAVLLSTSDARWVGAAHAGWRGLVAGILPRMVAALAEASGAQASSLVAAVGPSIGVSRYEVGTDVANAFHEAGLVAAVRLAFGPKPHVDLRSAAVLQLSDAGVKPTQIDTTDRCTFDDAASFFSYRRDGAAAGRMAACIVPRSA